MEEWLYSSKTLDLGARWMRMVSFAPAALPSVKELRCTHWIGDWMDPNDGLDAVEKSLLPLPGIEPRSSSP
jgi:hypothetical protein